MLVSYKNYFSIKITYRLNIKIIKQCYVYIRG
jgi:hypothetical protein